MPVLRSPVNVMPGVLALPNAAVSVPAEASNPKLVLAKVPTVTHAVLAALRIFSSPVVVSDHHIYA